MEATLKDIAEIVYDIQMSDMDKVEALKEYIESGNDS